MYTHTYIYIYREREINKEDTQVVIVENEAHGMRNGILDETQRLVEESRRLREARGSSGSESADRKNTGAR